MSDSCRSATPDVEPFEDRIDILFRELELAIKWQRPSILFAIYGSEHILTDAELSLEGKLIDLGQKAFRFQIKDEESADLASRFAEIADQQQMVFFISGLRRGGGPQGLAAYSSLNQHREYFIENQIRIVFWLTEEEAIDLAYHAPDYWAYRHRVIEFVESPESEEVLSHALESAWQGSGETRDTLEEIDAKISLNESLLTDLPEGDGSTAMNANLYLTLGVLHWRRGDYQKATKFLQTALQAAITMEDKWFEAECLNAIALVYSDLGRVDDAIEAYQQAILLAPDQIFPWNNLGNLYIKLERNDDALSAFHKAIEHNPADAVSWNGLGNAYFKLGRVEEASATYQKAIELAPNFVQPWNGLGNAYDRLGRMDEASEAYQKAAQLNGRSAQPWIGLGSVYFRQGNHVGALEAYQRAIDIDPKSAPAWNGLGDAYQGLNDRKKAQAAHQKASELSPNAASSSEGPLPLAEPEGAVRQETAPIADGELAASQEDGAGERVADPVLPAETHAADGSLPAEKTAAGTPGEDPTRSVSLAPEISVPAEAGAVKQGNEGSVTTMNADTKSALEWNKLGHSHLKAGSYDEAIAAYIRAIEVSPDLSWPYIHNLAMAHYHKGEHRGKTAGALSPDDPARSTGAQPQPAPSEPVSGTSASGGSTTDPTQPMARPLSGKLAPASPASPETAGSPQPDINTGEMGDWLRQLESEKGPGLDTTDSLTGHYLNETIREDLYGFGRTETATSDMPSPADDAGQAALSEQTSDSPTTAAQEPSDPQAAPSEDEPQDAYEWNELGNIQLKAGSCDRAIQAYERAIELSPEFGWPYSNLGLAYSHKGMYQEAIPLYQKSIELLRNNKEKAITWNRMGDAYRRLNDHDNAVKSYQKAVQLDTGTNSLLKRVRLSLLGNLRS